MPDGMPAGLAFKCGVGSAGGTFVIVGETWVLDAMLRPLITKRGRSADLKNIPSNMVDRFVPLVRWQLAIMEGDSLSANSGWISLRRFASDRNYKLWENVAKARFALDAPGGQILFPLASFQAKVGTHWRDAGGMILIRNGEPYIPAAFAASID